MKISAIFLLLTCFALSCYTQSTPIASDCTFLQSDSELNRIQCGYLEVPENHQQPEGQKIRIAYAVIKTNHDNPSYPMIYFSGGPGGASLTPGNLKNWHQNPLGENRDLIIFDQRGIQHSSELPNMEFELFDVMALDADVDEEQRLIRNVMDKFEEKAKQMGKELQNYNSFQNARDVGVLMKHLGYKRYNLYGGSYGTRLARIVQDLFPDNVNGVILNSPNPLGGDFLISRLHSYSLALERIFDYCQKDADCKTAYPDLRADYLSAINALKEQPFSVEIDGQTFNVNAQDAIYLLRRLLYGTDSREKAPLLIQAFKNHESEPIIDVLHREMNLIEHYNATMWLAVERYEMFDPRNSAQVIDSFYQTLPLFPEKLGQFTSLYMAGQTWAGPYLPTEQRTFQSSDIPTIIFVNRYDPVTPPENGKIMQEQLSNSQLFILDEGGHGGGDWDCRLKVMNDFMNDPEAHLDSGCLNLYVE